VAIGVWAALTAVAPPPPDTVPVAVATRDLAPGTRLEAGDLRTTQIPAAAAPTTVVEVAEAAGRVLTAPRAPGEMVTTTALGDSDLLRGLPAGMVALPLPLADPMGAGLVAPGDRVDVFAAVPTAAGTEVAVVGRDLPVLRAPRTESGSTDEWALGSVTDVGDWVVVAVSSDQARAVVAGATDGSLWLAVRASA
jgi:Flp pilus assembly protein CpaB